MASTVLNLSNWQYTVNGGRWQQGSGHDVSIGVDGTGSIYRGYISFNLSSFSASHIITGGSLYFKRNDSWGTKKWAIGLTDTLPAQNFSTSAFKHTIATAYSSASASENTISIPASSLTPYVGKTVYVLFLAGQSGNSYGEIETDGTQVPKLTINYNYAKSTMSVSNVTAGNSTTVTVTRQDSAYTHTLTASVGSNTTTIVTKSSSTSISWTPAVATYAPLIAPSTSATITYTLTTYSGNTQIGTDTKTATLSLPAKSSLSASNVTAGNSTSVTVTRNSTAYTHSLSVAVGSNTTTLATKVTTSPITWTPAIADYAPLITTAMSATMTYTLTTYCGSTVIGTATTSVTLSLPAASVKPSLALTVEDPNGYATVFGGYVVGKSAYRVTATPTYRYGAKQSSLSISANASTYSSSPAVTGTVQPGQSSISASVTDTRSQSASASQTTTLLPYTAPSLTIGVVRCDSSGTEDSGGAYCKVTYTWDVTALNNVNTYALDVKYKKVSDSTYTTVTQTITAYSGTATYIFAADTDSSYNVVVELTDYFGTTTASKILSTAAVVFDLYHDGTGMAFGKVAETANLMDIAWPVKFRGSPITFVDSNGVNRLAINIESGNLLFRDSSNSDVFLLRTDGTASYRPLPVNQGGTGQTTQFPKVRSVTGSVQNAAGSWLTLCSTTLPAGYSYLIFGSVATNDGGSVQVLASIEGASITSATRTNTGSGQGVMAYAHQNVSTSDVTVYLRTYGYTSGTRTYTGRLLVYQFPAMPTF